MAAQEEEGLGGRGHLEVELSRRRWMGGGPGGAGGGFGKDGDIGGGGFRTSNNEDVSIYKTN